MWCEELNLFVTSKEVTFNESLVFLGRSGCISIYMDLNGVKLKVEFQLATSEPRWQSGNHRSYIYKRSDYNTPQMLSQDINLLKYISSLSL